jgi:hypothetical protein
LSGRNERASVWGWIALLGALGIAASYLFDWLDLSVDAVVRDEVFVSDTHIAAGDLPGGFAILGIAVVAGIAALIAGLRPRAARVAGAIVGLGGVAAIGYAIYVYASRVDIFTDVAVDATATDDVPASAVQRALDLAMRAGGVDVRPQTGMIVALVAGVIAVVAGVLLFARSRPEVRPTSETASDRG